MPTALPSVAAYQHAYEARQRAAGQPAPAFPEPISVSPFVKATALELARRRPSPGNANVQRRPRADENFALVYIGEEFWSVIGEFTTPGPGQAPAFVAASIRMVNADGSQGPELIDFFSAMSVAEFERLAVEFLTEGRA